MSMRDFSHDHRWLSVNTATVRKQQGAEVPLARIIDQCAARGIRAISPWRDQVAAAGLDATARQLRSHGMALSGYCRGGFFPAAAEAGLRAEVIDLRSVSPLDIDTVAESVRRTGRLVIAHEAPTAYGAGAELAARISEECFYSLEAPVLRVGAFDTPYPASRIEEDYLPDLDRVLDAVDRSMTY